MSGKVHSSVDDVELASCKLARQVKGLYMAEAYLAPARAGKKYMG